MKKKAIAWATMSVLALAGFIISFMNLWAAADLGYDTSERGKMILRNWSYATLLTTLSSIAFAMLAIRNAWHSGRNTTDTKQ